MRSPTQESPPALPMQVFIDYSQYSEPDLLDKLGSADWNQLAELDNLIYLAYKLWQAGKITDCVYSICAYIHVLTKYHKAEFEIISFSGDDKETAIHYMRQYIEKNSHFKDLSEDDIAEIVDEIEQIPRSERVVFRYKAEVRPNSLFHKFTLLGVIVDDGEGYYLELSLALEDIILSHCYGDDYVPLILVSGPLEPSDIEQASEQNFRYGEIYTPYSETPNKVHDYIYPTPHAVFIHDKYHRHVMCSIKKKLRLALIYFAKAFNKVSNTVRSRGPWRFFDQDMTIFWVKDTDCSRFGDNTSTLFGLMIIHRTLYSNVKNQESGLLTDFFLCLVLDMYYKTNNWNSMGIQYDEVDSNVPIFCDIFGLLGSIEESLADKQLTERMLYLRLAWYLLQEGSELQFEQYAKTPPPMHNWAKSKWLVGIEVHKDKEKPQFAETIPPDKFIKIFKAPTQQPPEPSKNCFGECCPGPSIR